MDKKIKDLWIEALISGTYKQGKGRLKNKDFYCVMGVLCDIASRYGIGEWNELQGFECRTEATYNALPKEVARWAGLNTRNPKLRVSDMSGNIGALNDYGYSFEELAKVIQKDL